MAVSEGESLIPEQVAVKYLDVGRGVDSCETIEGALELGTRTWRVWPLAPFRGSLPQPDIRFNFPTPIFFLFAMQFSLFLRSYASFAAEPYAFQSLPGFLSP